MIVLSKLNGAEFVLNCELIETIYANPDTTIHLTDGRIYIVQETMQQVIEKSIEYKREIYRDLLNFNNND